MEPNVFQVGSDHTHMDSLTHNGTGGSAYRCTKDREGGMPGNTVGQTPYLDFCVGSLDYGLEEVST